MSLHCILQYTAGYAKGMTKNCMHLPAEIGFETTKWLLTERNGDPYRIIATYRRENKHWPQIKAGDADAYQKCQSSWWRLKILAIFGVWMCWIHLTSRACYCRGYQAVLETSGLEMSWLYTEGTKGNQIWLTLSIL